LSDLRLFDNKFSIPRSVISDQRIRVQLYDTLSSLDNGVPSPTSRTKKCSGKPPSEVTKSSLADAEAQQEASPARSKYEIGCCRSRPSVLNLSDQPGRRRRKPRKFGYRFVRSSQEHATTHYSPTQSWTRCMKRGQHSVHCSNIGSFTSASSTTVPIARRTPKPRESA
jgi:hypothetical protein